MSSSGNPITCCCGCVFKCVCACILQILCIILVILGVIALILYLIFRPNPLKFSVTDASLTEFSLSPTNNLYYNLALNMDFKNPNERLGIYYDDIEVSTKYEGERFATTNLQPFSQGLKNTTSLNNISFKGQNFVMLGNNQLSKYDKDKKEGKYNIEVKLNLRIRLLIVFIKSKEIKPKIQCDLKVPLRSNGASSGKFEPTDCGFDW